MVLPPQTVVGRGYTFNTKDYRTLFSVSVEYEDSASAICMSWLDDKFVYFVDMRVLMLIEVCDLWQ